MVLAFTDKNEYCNVYTHVRLQRQQEKQQIITQDFVKNFMARGKRNQRI